MREGSLEAPTRHPIDWKSESYWDKDDLNRELERVYDICHGCRRCVSLCDSFPTLFDLVDESETMEVDGVAKEDFIKVVDQCYLCDLCYMTKCPYVPPHEWNVDFPHLMLRAKAVKFAEEGVKAHENKTKQHGHENVMRTLLAVLHRRNLYSAYLVAILGTTIYLLCCVIAWRLVSCLLFRSVLFRRVLIAAGSVLLFRDVRFVLFAVHVGRNAALGHRYVADIAQFAAGNKLESDKAQAALRAVDDGGWDYQHAIVHAVRGETDEAMSALQAAYEKRDTGLSMILGDPFLDNVRGDPRFEALVERMGIRLND